MTGDKTALMMVETTLQKMRLGGIFDHVGFGFHRYSTDKEWLVPHFEKMLYDQAMLTMAYSEAYQITKTPEYKQTAEEILTYVLRDMTDSRGGFYSAEDADSEGEEGLFYLWTIEELKSMFDESDVTFLTQLYSLESQGNFKDEATGQFIGRNIFYLEEKINTNDELERLTRIRNTLFEHREKRIHPLKDDKILTDWNGLMIAAFAKAGMAFENPRYVDAAKNSTQFLLKNLTDDNGRLKKRYRNGNAGLDAHLDDYAFLIWGLLELYDATLDISYLSEAIQFSRIMVEDFMNPDGGFYLGGDNSEKLIVRAMTGYDGAIPSGNSVAVMNLLRITRITGEVKWAEMADQLFKVFSKEIENAPTGFTYMLSAFLFESDSPKEIVIVGSMQDPIAQQAIKRLQTEYHPGNVILFKDTNDKMNQLNPIANWTNEHRPINDQTTFYVCEDFACKFPTTDLDQAFKLINE
jgi:uncharacterized protein YyaL (SSP411 family)